MGVLSRESLYQKVADSIISNGWTIASLSDVRQLPVRLEVKKNDIIKVLRIYIWNLTHGGNTRPEDEYRIQVKVDRFEDETNSTTLILGYLDELDVFAGFDISKHVGKPGWSASMQIKKDYLDQAKAIGISAYGKENGEIAIAFTPANLMSYVEDYFDLHSTGNLNKYLYPPEPEDFDDALEDEKEQENFRFSVSSYGADYPVDSIVKRITSDVIFIPPFQRKFVWNIKEASRFIESLILGLPVPGVFLSKEEQTNRLLIVDGQQRLFSLFSFYENNFKGRPFKLTGVQADLDGLGYLDLSAADRNRLNDSIIHATVIKQDEPDDNSDSIYAIFERLNSSGRLLTPQEVRACVYYGQFNEYLNNAILDKNWRDIFGKMNDRMKEQELLLRFFSLYFELDSYKKPLKDFLNSFMRKNRNFDFYSEEVLNEILVPSVKIVNQTFGNRSFRLGKAINVALFDSILIAVAKRIKKNIKVDSGSLSKAYAELTSDQIFLSYVKEATSDDTILRKRIEMAISKFDSVS